MQTKPEPNPRYASLPVVTAVTLILPNHPKVSPRTVEGADAQKLADLWRKLPPGSGARCFYAEYELIFLHGEKTVRRARVSWRCSHAQFAGETPIAPFDSSSREAKALLGMCQALLSPRT